MNVVVHFPDVWVRMRLRMGTINPAGYFCVLEDPWGMSTCWRGPDQSISQDAIIDIPLCLVWEWCWFGLGMWQVSRHHQPDRVQFDHMSWSLGSKAGVDLMLLFTSSIVIKRVGGVGEEDRQFQPQEIFYNMTKANQCPQLAFVALFIMKIWKQT